MDDVPESLTGDELAQRLGVSVRTLRSWMQARALPRPAARGRLTRFDRRLIVIAHAVAALRRDGVPLTHIPRFLASKSDLQLREIGGLPPPREPAALPPPPKARVLPPNAASTSEASRAELDAPSVVSSEELARQAAIASREPGTGGGPVGAVWRRIELLPGLELHVRADATAFVHGVAAAIVSGRFDPR